MTRLQIPVIVFNLLCDGRMQTTDKAYSVRDIAVAFPDSLGDLVYSPPVVDESDVAFGFDHGVYLDVPLQILNDFDKKAIVVWHLFDDGRYRFQPQMFASFEPMIPENHLVRRTCRSDQYRLQKSVRLNGFARSETTFSLRLRSANWLSLTSLSRNSITCKQQH